MNKKTDGQKNQRILVFARCRPLNSIERKQCSPSVVDVIPDKQITVKDRNANREFLFDRVFPPDTKQISVYKAVVEPLIQEVLMGYNCTVFAYGQTGTGKTYTMEGERNDSKCSWEDDPGAGIIPRSLHQLFEDLNKEENVEFSVRVSFLELYNEELFDLLSSTELSRLRLYEHGSKKGSVVIHGLEEIIVNSKDEVYAILEKGTARRQTAATMLNATSSRSHTVFSVTVHIKENTIEGEELLKTGKLNLVDLAGSENVGRSGAVDKRAREAGNINQSLLTLGRVITALIEKQPHVPYRESKLTRLLQDSLGGHTKTSIIATISPALCNFDETISTLDYATKAKSITINPEVNQKMTKRALIREYTEEIEKLRRDLVALRSKDGFYIDMENYAGLLNEIDDKKNMIKHLSEKIEELKEENSEFEKLNKVTKEKLIETNEKLNETSERFNETTLKLSNTESALNYTQKVLTETALERDEKQLLLNVQCKTEKKLSQQAQKLLVVANETTNDVEKLHAKIDRKTAVEQNNQERCKEFRMMYQKQFAMLDDLVSHSEKQQMANLLTTKQDIDEIFKFLQNHQMQTNNYLNQFIKLIPLNLKKVSEDIDTRTECETKWTHTLIKKLNVNKERLLSKQSEFLLEKFPELLCELNKKNSEMEQWILNTHKQLSEKIRSEKDSLEEKSAKRKEIQLFMKESLEAICKNHEELLNDFKVQTCDLYSQEDEFEKDFEEKLNDLRRSVMSLDRLSEWRKKLRQNAFETESSLIKKFETNTLKLKELQQPVRDLCNYECTVEDDKTALNEVLTVMCLDEFSEKQQSLQDSQEKIATAFENFTVENGKEEKLIFHETENALNDHLSLVSDNNGTINASISAIHSSLEDYAQSGITSTKENVHEIEKGIEKANDNLKQSQEVLCSITNKLKDEILKRDIEFEKFISEDLVKDIPTGTTPQRKDYIYPRLLAATSPHERILKRYRTDLATNTALAINLPLNSSFNELDEFKTSPVHLEQSTYLTDVNNGSLSSSDSDCDTDSCASSVSDASVDSVKNKENMKNSKKKSRLPKRLPHKGFVKPAQPLTRKPLVSSNSTITELSEI